MNQRNKMNLITKMITDRLFQKDKNRVGSKRNHVVKSYNSCVGFTLRSCLFIVFFALIVKETIRSTFYEQFDIDLEDVGFILSDLYESLGQYTQHINLENLSSIFLANNGY